MREPSSEAPKVYTVGDFLSSKEQKLEALKFNNGSDAEAIINRSSLREQIASIRDGLSFFVIDQGEVEEETKPTDWNRPIEEIAKETSKQLLDEGRNVNLTDFSLHYNEETELLNNYYNQTFGTKKFDDMDKDQLAHAIEIKRLINLRTKLEEEMDMFLPPSEKKKPENALELPVNVIDPTKISNQ